MTIKPAKFAVKKPVVVDGHEVAGGVYVGQKISETEIERSANRTVSYFLHLAAPVVVGDETVIRRFDLDVTDLVTKGRVTLC